MMKVKKRDGEIVDFEPSKVRKSLINSGVSEETIKKVLLKITDKKISIISTDKLYSLIYDLVRKYESKYSASIYSLKNALLKLGPDGYTFEDFIAKIFTLLDYKVKVRQIFSSNCITHEVDVSGHDFFVECKYSNSGGASTGIKDVLYSHARFLDLKDASKNKNYSLKTLWVASNTRFSHDSIDYAEYWKIKLMGWKYGKEMSLSHLIDKNGWYPITLLPSLSKRIFSIFRDHNILIINDVCEKSDEELKKLGINNSEISSIRKDCESLIEKSKLIKKENGD